jgi:uncharacterized protein (TIGR01777 family)
MDNVRMRQCLLTGGTGFVGRRLARKMAAKGWQLTVLSRQGNQARARMPRGTAIVNDLQSIDKQKYFDAVINLAGEPIADQRWTDERRRVLEDSRVTLTENLVDWIQQANKRPPVLISASAVGWYGDGGDRELNEEDAAQDEYTHQLCDAWEQAARRAESLGIRTCVVRIGLVVGPDGGFLARMRTPFRFGLGGRIGNGQQWMSWIHIDDLAAMINWLLANNALTGVFNGTAPNPVTNRQFSKALGRVLHRPAVLPLPAPALRLALGDMSRLLLTGQKVLPAHAIEHGFEFKFPELEPALRDVLP